MEGEMIVVVFVISIVAMICLVLTADFGGDH
jgi:hypothetical protein